MPASCIGRFIVPSLFIWRWCPMYRVLIILVWKESITIQSLSREHSKHNDGAQLGPFMSMLELYCGIIKSLYMALKNEKIGIVKLLL